jgi:hypothetical protein
MNNNPIRYNDPSGHEVPLPSFPSSINIPVNNGFDLIAAVACFFLCGFLPVHFESYGPGQGAIVGDTAAEIANKTTIGLGATILDGDISSPSGNSADKFNGEPATSGYPEVIDPRTGQPIPAPPNNLQWVPPEQRVTWGTGERAEFIRQWYEKGNEPSAGGSDQYDIHHIIPREYGGTNEYENLVPVLRDVHQQQLNPWWYNYDPKER